MDDQLIAKGWHLSDAGLKACKDSFGKENVTANDIIKIALNSDLRQIARKKLPENVNNGQVESVNGPIVLQISKVRNVSAPLANQDSKTAPRMLKFNLTDGCTHCSAIEFDNVSFLNANLIPGTKVCLNGSDIRVVKGVILLDNGNVKLLGGEVENLKAKWVASKQVAATKRDGKTNDDPPPAFTEFDGTKPFSKGSHNRQKRNLSQEYKGRDERGKDKKQPHVKKNQAMQGDQKAPDKSKDQTTSYDSSQERNQTKSETGQKRDNKNQNSYRYDRSEDTVNNNIGDNNKPINDFKGGRREYQRNDHGKNEYKSLWNSKSTEQSANNYKDTEFDNRDKKVNSATYVDRKVNEKNSNNWDKRDTKSASSYNDRERDNEADSRYKKDFRSMDRREQEYQKDQQHQDHVKTTKSYNVERERKFNQDTQVNEKKITKEAWADEGYKSNEYRNEEKRKDVRGIKPYDSRTTFKNRGDIDARNSDRRDQKSSVKYSKSKEEQPDYVNNREGSGGQTEGKYYRSYNDNRDGKGGQSDRKYYKNYNDGKNERELQKNDDSTYNRKAKVLRDADKSYGDAKKPVVYDASNQSWGYDEVKDKPDDSQSNDMQSVYFKRESKYDKKDNNFNRNPQREGDTNRYDSKHASGSKNSKFDDYTSDRCKDNSKFTYKNDQKGRNWKSSDKYFHEPDKNVDRKEFLQNKQYRRPYNDNYNYRDRYGNKDRSDYKRDDFHSKKQADAGYHSPKSSNIRQEQQYVVEEISNDGENHQPVPDDVMKYNNSPGKRIQLDELFGKNMKISNDSEDKTMAANKLIDNSGQTGSDVPLSEHTNVDYDTSKSKKSSREIMERCLEQVSRDFVYTPYVNQQQLPYYPQTLQTVPNIQVSPSSQFIRYVNEHHGSDAVSQYIYNQPRANFQYNHLQSQHPHQQHQQPQHHQPQNVVNDLTYYQQQPNNVYYYPLANPQLHEQYHQ